MPLHQNEACFQFKSCVLHAAAPRARQCKSLLAVAVAVILLPRGQEAVELRVFQDRRLIDRMLQCGKSSVIGSKFGVNLLQIL